MKVREAAIIAGTSIIIMAIAAMISTDLTINTLVEPESASATLKNIRSSEMLFRIGVVCWIIVLICDVIAAWGLYIFLKPVNHSFALIMAWFRLIYAAILGTSLASFVHVLLLINDGDYMSTIGVEQLQSQVLMHINGFNDTWSIGLVVFGIHIFFLGYLILKSGYIPKIFGVLLLVAFIGYIFINITNLLFPQYEDFMIIVGWIFIVPMLSEVALGIWLLLNGRNVQIPYQKSE